MTLHTVAVPALVHALTQLRHVLRKGAAHAEAQGRDSAELLQMRLAPDMFPLVRQVQIATDLAKGAVGRLSGAEVPRFEDTETRFDELDARIGRALGLLSASPADAWTGAEAREITIPTGAHGDLRFDGVGYLYEFVFPNVYFHASMAYALLRHAGVPLGKADYLGPIGGAQG
jgi:uncharacterized protein